MPVDRWPNVLGEERTIQKLLREGLSLARCGDGEAKVAYGEAYVREEANEALAKELRRVLAQPDPRCLVGIPTLDKRSPKYENWIKRAPRFLPLLSPGVPYVSAFVSRPDSSPWIITPAYAQSMQALWAEKNVVLISEPTSKLRVVVPKAAKQVVFADCPSHGAYAHIDRFERLVMDLRPDVAILSHGVSATCLAHRLAVRGIQALDLGSVGAFLVRMLLNTQPDHIFPMALRHPECENSAALGVKLEAAGFEVYYGGEKEGSA